MDGIAELLGRHLLLAVLPVFAGTVVAVGLKLIADPPAAPRSRLAVLLDRLTGLAGALPVVAVWVLLPIITGLPLMRTAHLEIALSLLVLAAVYPALRSVPRGHDQVRAARALGFAPWQRGLFSLRRWLPALGRGLAAAWPAAVLGVTLAALLSDRAADGLGRLIVEGWRGDDPSRVLTGTALVLVIAAAGDGFIRLTARLGGIRAGEVR